MESLNIKWKNHLNVSFSQLQDSGMMWVGFMVWKFFPETTGLLLRCKMNHAQRRLGINMGLAGHATSSTASKSKEKGRLSNTNHVFSWKYIDRRYMWPLPLTSLSAKIRVRSLCAWSESLSPWDSFLSWEYWDTEVEVVARLWDHLAYIL